MGRSRSHLGLKIKCLGLVLVSYHRVSFTSQYAQLFASLQNCTYIVLFTDSQAYLFIAMQVHETVSDRDVIPESTEHGDDAIHCFSTMLKVEGLERRLGLGLARSWSRLVAKIRHLSHVSVSWNYRKVLVSVSSRTTNRMSQSRLVLVS